MIIIHNLALLTLIKVGTFNSTGKKYLSHDLIWLRNEIQELEIVLGDRYTDTTPIALPWINGNFYQQTTEEMGIVPIPETLRVQAGMQPFMPGTDEKQKQPFLARMQGPYQRT